MKLITKTLLLSFLLISLCLYVEGKRSYMKKQKKDDAEKKEDEEIKNEEFYDIEGTMVDDDVKEENFDKMIQQSKENKIYDEISGILSTFMTSMDKADIMREVWQGFSKKPKCTQDYLKALYKSGKDYSDASNTYKKQIFGTINNSEISASLKNQKKPGQILEQCYKIQQESTIKYEEAERLQEQLKKDSIFQSKIKLIKELNKDKKKLKGNLEDAHDYFGETVLENVHTKGYSPGFLKSAKSALKSIGRAVGGFFSSSRLPKINKYKNYNEKVNGFEEYIKEKKEKIQKINEQIKENAFFVYKQKLKIDKYQKIIDQQKELSSMDCVNFAIDPSAGYNYGIIRKTLNKIDFYLSTLECAASTPTFSAKITVVKNKIFDIVSANQKLMETLKKDSSFISIIQNLISRTLNAVLVFAKLVSAIKKKKEECLFKGMTECAYLSGVIKGYVLKLILAIGGVSY